LKRIEPRPLIGAVLLLSGPLFALLLTGHGIDPNSLTLALVLVPIVATITRSALDDTPPGSFAARTWPALAALAGLLLLVPQPSFTNPITDTILIIAPLATGIGAALFSTSYSSTNPSSLPMALSAAALLFFAAWLVQFLLHHTTAHLSPLSSLLDAVTALVTLLALQRIGLTRWSAQFALVPLAVILQGFILLRPGLDAYNSAGIALLLLGVIFLLLPQPLEKAS
jgi:drug/metabolite transporter (DMT)-like permease